MIVILDPDAFHSVKDINQGMGTAAMFTTAFPSILRGSRQHNVFSGMLGLRVGTGRIVTALSTSSVLPVFRPSSGCVVGVLA